jgi:iron complex outermembrane recepter protein
MPKKNFSFVILTLVFIQSKAQQITGTITGRDSKPVAAVTVHLLNSTATTVSNEQGAFSLSNVAPGEYIISLSAIGYAAGAEKISVKEKDNTPLHFQLQTQLVQLDAVTVTAEKREDLLQHIPAAISSLSATQAEAFRLWNSKELTAIVPNLFAGNSGDERNVTSIRGITTTSYDPAVATYIDGVNQFSLDTYIPQLQDIERIEVLRGPQGTLYGRNAMGGVINIITKQPTNTTTGFAEVNVGNYNQQRYSAGIRTALIKNKLFFGASGVYTRRDGFYKNEFTNSSFDKQSGISGNYYLKYLPQEKWVITLNIKHQGIKNNGAFPLVNGIEEALNNPFKLSQNAIGKMEDNSMNASLSVNHPGSNIDFSSQLAWQQNRRVYQSPIDGDFSPLDAVTVINDFGGEWNKVKVFTHEMRFASAARKTKAFNWTAGTYFFHQNNPNKQATHFGKDAGLLGVPDTDFSSINTSTGKNTGIALYGQVNYKLTSQLSVIAGLRYDYENKKLAVKGEYQKDGQDAFITTPDTAGTAHFSALSPKLGLQYQLAANSNIYASYSRGFRTGGLTQLSTDPSQPPLYPYKPEYSNNIELGIKNSFLNNRLTVNATLFYTRVNDAQVPTLILPDAITVTKNTGRLNSKGAELELSFKPVKGLQIEYNAGYTNAQYQSLKVSSNGDVVNLDGKKQIFTPDVTSMLALQYSYLVSAAHHIQLVARGEWFYLGRRYFDLANTIQQSPNSLLNTRAGISTRHLELFFWARNIGNKKYIEYAYDFGAVHFANPSTYGVSVKALF